jgi:cellulose biosynthesis protein BcsQ
VRTTAVMNEHGGSGKTTTTISLAAVLAERGFRGLVVDCPPNLGLLAANAPAAAHEVLVPIETHGIAAIGLGDLIHTVEDRS